MKKQLSLLLAVLMLCCSVFGSGITSFAGINASDAQAINLNESVEVQTEYDAKNEISYSWLTFTSTKAGAYSFAVTNKDENSLVMPMIVGSKAEADKLNLDKALEPVGAIASDDYTIGVVYNLKANKTYYVNVFSLNFENPKATPKVSLKVTTHKHSYKAYTIKADTEEDGETGEMCTTCSADRNIKTIPKIKSVSLSTTSYTYNGKGKTPSVTVKDRKGKKLVKNKDYTVSYPSKRTSVGKYTVTVKFKGKYTGTVKKSFTIKPKSTSISKLTPGKKKFTAKWKKQTSQTTGYQIQYSTSSKFKSAKTVTVSKNKTTSKTISKLKAKKKYYVRIRTYKTVKVKGKSTKIYSSWSKSKSVTTKK